MYEINNEDVISADLISVEEANKLPRCILANGDWWWLSSPGNNSNYAAFVRFSATVNALGFNVTYDTGEVRPALTISNSPELEIGETVKVFGLIAQYIGGDKVLLCEPILYSRFDAESHDFETSEVKQKIDNWFNEMRGFE